MVRKKHFKRHLNQLLTIPYIKDKYVITIYDYRYRFSFM